MARLPSRLAAAAAVILAAAPLPAQAPAAAAPATSAAAAPIVEIYRREVFSYQRTGRPDPFQPLLSVADLGYRVEDLRLTSIIYSPDPRMSVAVFAVADCARRFRLRTGQSMGGITVSAIYPNRVDLRVEDFGVARIETLTLQRRRVGVDSRDPAAPTATQGQPMIIQQAPPPQRTEPAGPLRRGGRPTTPAPTTPRPKPSTGNR